MRPKVKITLAVVASLFVTAHLLLWVIMSNIGPRVLQESLSHHLGFNVSADRVKVSLLSQGVMIKNLALTDPATPGAKPFFTAKTVTLHLNLFALIAKRLTIRKAVIYYPSLTVWRNLQGRWILPVSQMPREKKSPAPLTVQPETQHESSQGGGLKFHFHVKFYKTEIRKGEVLFYDQTISPPFWVRLKNIQAKGQFATPTLLRLVLTGEVEARDPAPFEFQGECELRDGKFSSYIVGHLRDLDITLLTPYFQHRSPVLISGGKLSLQSTVRCVDNVLKDSAQEITLKNLKLHSWNKEFLEGKVFGISNRELADYLERNADQINMDFSLSGPLADLKSLPEEETWRLLGLTIADHWLHQTKTQ